MKEKLEKSFATKAQQYFNKTFAISQWKNEVLLALNPSKQTLGPIRDQAIFLEFRNLSISQIDNPQSQKSFENIIAIYIEKITNREKLIQENL